MQTDDATRTAVMACVRSSHELDVLLHLALNRDRYCSPEAIAADTGLPRNRVSEALEVLASRNLLDVRIAGAVVYRLDPASVRCRRRVAVTLEAASRGRAAVLELIE